MNALIKEAQQLAKGQGVEVLGWNDKAGEEFIGVKGGNSSLLALQKDMELRGWTTWPVAEYLEGSFLDFARRPQSPQDIAAAADLVAMPEQDIPRTEDKTFAFSGYVSPAVSLIVKPAGLALLAGVLVHRSSGIGPTLIGAAIVGVIVFVWSFCAEWLEVKADGVTVKTQFGRCGGDKQEEPISDIKRAKIWVGALAGKQNVEKTLIVNFKSGKVFWLNALPEKQLFALYWAIRNSTG